MSRKKKTIEDKMAEDLQAINDAAIKRHQEQIDNAPKIDRVDFWKYQALSHQHTIAEASLKKIELTLMNFETQTEVLKYKMLQIKGQLIPEARKNIEEAKTAWSKFKEEVESRIGMSLNDVEIDEDTLVVKKSSSTAT